MAEVLSQSEIDQLLNKIQAGDQRAGDLEPEKDVQLFDFRLPNRISKNQIRSIRNIHENFAEGLSSFLMTKLQTLVNIAITSVDQIYYSEYVLSVSSPACLFTFDIKSTDIKGVVELSPELAFALVDRLLGGTGKSSKATKVVTPIEQKVLIIFIERVMQELKKAWHIIDELIFIYDRFESDVDFLQITSQSDSVLIVSCELTIGETKSLLNLCYATYAFDVILNKLTSQSFQTIKSSRVGMMSAKKLISENLKSAQIPLVCELGTTSITMDNLLKLETGDVLMTDIKAGGEVTVKIDGKPIFFGYPGVTNGRKAVKITSRAERK